MLPMLFSTAVLGETEVHLDVALPQTDRRRGVGVILCWGACSGTCTIACGPGAPACSIPCAAVCRAACAASTGCFDGDATVRMEDGRQERVADLNELLMGDAGGLWAERKIPRIHSALKAGDGMSVAYEPLLGVEKLLGDFVFNEIVVETDAGRAFAVNTTSDHGWVSKSRRGNTTCVKESQAIAPGDEVMVRDPANAALTWGKVSSTRSWPSDHKYMLFTKSGLALVNDLLITVLCEAGHEFANDCRADPVIDLEARLGMMKRKEADELMALIDNGIQFKVADSVAAALKSSSQYRLTHLDD